MRNMALTRTVLSNNDATLVRISVDANREIIRRAKSRGVAAWVIVDELLEVAGEKQG